LSSYLTPLKQNKITAYILFFIWPVFGLLFAIVNFRASYSKNIVWFFCAFFGYTFIATEGWDIDANRYKENFLELAERQDESAKDLFLEAYVGKGIYASPDFYLHGLTVVVSRFTGSFKIYFAVVGFIFGYFFSRNVFFLIDHIKDDRLLILSVLFIITIGFVIPFWSINGFRFRTAAHIFIFGALRVLIKKRYRYLALVAITPLVHFSMAFAILVFGIYYLVGNRIYLYMFGLLVSMLFINVDPAVVNQNSELAPIFLQNRIRGYSSEDYVSGRIELRNTQNWYVVGHQIALNMVLYLMIFLLWFKRKKWMNKKAILSLFSFAILFLALSNVFSLVPSMDRFLLVATIFCLISIVYIIQYLDMRRYFSKLFMVCFPLILLFLIVEVRISFDFIGLNTLFLNPFLAGYFPDSLPLIEFFK